MDLDRAEYSHACLIVIVTGFIAAPLGWAAICGCPLPLPIIHTSTPLSAKFIELNVEHSIFEIFFNAGFEVPIEHLNESVALGVC